MRAIRKGWQAALACFALTGAATTPALARDHVAVGAPALDLVSDVALSARLHELTFRAPAVASAALGPIPGNPTGQTRVRVLLPETYGASPRARYPVLYLYHGGGGNQSEWTTPATKGEAEELTRGLPLIVVMPDGGLGGGYADWFNGGAGGPPKWKTYHLEQLIPWIDAHYRTIPNRGGRATAGLSMGGGGLRYAAQRPDLIGATAAFSGDVDILQPASDWNGMGAPISRLIWGDRKSQEVRWRGANGPDLAANLGNTDVSIFSGDTGRPEGVYILPGSIAVHDRLNTFGIAHQFTVYPGMTHSWPTWNRALAEWLPRLMSRFGSYNPAERELSRVAPPAGPRLPVLPRSFVYSTIDPVYAMHGWDVRIERAAIEFSALEVTDGREFSLIGSGKAVVRMPALGMRNQAVRIVISTTGAATRSRTLRLRTDGSGRLSVPIDLGTTNPHQQYSPQADANATGKPAIAMPFPVLNNGSEFLRVEVRLVGGNGMVR